MNNGVAVLKLARGFALLAMLAGTYTGRFVKEGIASGKPPGVQLNYGALWTLFWLKRPKSMRKRWTWLIIASRYDTTIHKLHKC